MVKVPTLWAAPDGTSIMTDANAGLTRIEQDSTQRIEQDGTIRIENDVVQTTKQPTEWDSL